MSDWQVNDLALCVDDRPNSVAGHNAGLVCGRVYTVTAVVFDWYGFPGLQLAELPNPRWVEAETRSFNAQRFVKVTPPKADEFDTEVIEMMARKPVEA